MQKHKKEIMVSEEDYHTITAVLKGSADKTSFNPQDAALLQEELKTARLVTTGQLPADVVRLYSQVKVRDEQNKKIISLSVVLPGKADIRQMKISVFSPMGTALIGYAKGQKVKWKVPSGEKTFTILEVKNGDN
jgi:regulator of nucleoside diphosphate kinase